MIIKIEPYPKPRMTRADKWKRRKSVLNYWAFKDELLLKSKGYEVGEVLKIQFFLTMPNSWSKTKKKLMDGEPHLQKPDLDNLVKSFLDCLCKNDSFIHTIEAKKVWTYQGKINVE